MIKRIFFIIIAPAIFLTSCKRNSPLDFQPGDKGELEVEFDNVVGGANLELNTGVYVNASGESYKISQFNYYISNIRLQNADGTTYTVPRDSSYFLIRESNPSQLITLRDIPAGNYTGISFVIGVDSVKSIAPAAERTGALDPAGEGLGMYESINTGYIFLNMEGASTAATSGDKQFRFHIGGYGGFTSPTYNNIKLVTMTAPGGAAAEVRKDKPEAPHIHIMADAAKVMNGPVNISIAANTTVIDNPFSVTIANNYVSMFRIDHIHND